MRKTWVNLLSTKYLEKKKYVLNKKQKQNKAKTKLIKPKTI